MSNDIENKTLLEDRKLNAAEFAEKFKLSTEMEYSIYSMGFAHGINVCAYEHMKKLKQKMKTLKEEHDRETGRVHS